MKFKMTFLVALMFVFGVNSSLAQGFGGNYVTDSEQLAAINSGFANNGRSFSIYGTPLAMNSATDFVALGRSFPTSVGPTPNAMFIDLYAPLSSFASAGDIAQVNARINQVFQQVQNLNQQFQETNRGIAAVAAMANIWMPSAPGRTAWAINGAAFNSEFGAGFSFAHRLNFSIPIAITAAYGNGGGTAHVGRVGLMGEF